MLKTIFIGLIFLPFFDLSCKPVTNSNISEWSQEQHRKSYQAIQAIATDWGDLPFLVYGKDGPFKWNIIPFQFTSNPLSRYWQQLKVAFQLLHYGEARRPTKIKKVSRSLIEKPSDDPFCDPEIIKRQQVLEGDLITVLYNYKPLGKEHFLFVTKKHKRDFRELTEEEYLESMKLTQFVIKRLKQTQPVHNTYLFHKTGLDAGQSVPHWHLHLVITETELSDWGDKVKWLWKVTFGTSPLKPEALTEKVKHFKKTFHL